MAQVMDEAIDIPETVGTAPSFFQNILPTPLSATSSRVASIDIENMSIDTKVITNTPLDAWLPITASRNGNAYYAAMHTLNSNIGFQALLLPIAFRPLGWTWGIICLSILFAWQFYTIWLLIQLHESVPGTRYNRYLQLSMAAFGEKLGKLLTLLPVMYLSGGACVMLIMTAGESMKLFMKTTTSPTTNSLPLTTIECYLVFICLAVVLSQLLPNLNSVAWISFVGAIVAVAYCTILWSISISKTRPNGISYDPVKPKLEIGKSFSVLNALGTIALAFRGHNLILEIQATIPSSESHLSRRPMSRGVTFAYLLIGCSLFALAIGGYWAYGDQIPNAGILKALHTFHRHDTSRFVLKLTSLLVAIHCLTSFQIYAMPVLDNLEFAYISRKKKPCTRWIHVGIRIFFGCLTLFIAVAIPFLKGLAGVVGGIALPVTFAYPCFMWILIKKPQPYSSTWWINLLLGGSGMVLSAGVFAGGVYSLVHPGIYIRFFKP